MPIYEYECQKCGERFEVTQKMSDPPLKKHGNGSKCGGKVAKLMSANTFHLKGTGWYKTDYAKPAQETRPTAAKGKTEAADTAAAKEPATGKETPAKKEPAAVSAD